MDAVTCLQLQHRFLDRLVSQMAGARTAAGNGEISLSECRTKILEYVDALSAHLTVGDTLITMLRAPIQDSPRAGYFDAHRHSLRSAMSELLDLGIEDTGFLITLSVIEDEAAFHLREEAELLLPIAREQVSQAQLDAMGMDMALTFRDLLAGAPLETLRPTPGRSSVEAEEDPRHHE